MVVVEEAFREKLKWGVALECGVCLLAVEVRDNDVLGTILRGLFASTEDRKN